MAHAARPCLVCSSPMDAGDSVTLCAACWSVAHTACVATAGPCVMPGCHGDLEEMAASEVPSAVRSRIAAANAEPVRCPDCGGATEFGAIVAPQRRAYLRRSPGVWFIPEDGGQGRHIPDVTLYGRRCRGCLRLTMAGSDLRALAHRAAREWAFCPRCGGLLVSGALDLCHYVPGPLRFIPQAPPGSSPVRGHLPTPDRFVASAGPATADKLASQACRRCGFCLVHAIPVVAT